VEKLRGSIQLAVATIKTSSTIKVGKRARMFVFRDHLYV
jgi:hypothetical protein